METKLNAKQRRRLLRQQLQQQQQEQEQEQNDGSSTEKVTQQAIVGSIGHESDKVATFKTTDDNQPGQLLMGKRKRVDGTKRSQKKRKHEQKKIENGQENGQDEAPGAHKSIHLTLFVGQLPFRATEGTIRNHFTEAGDIKLRMLTDKKTKKFRGMAFIEVKDSKALGAALSRHHTLLQGRRINVELTASGGGNKSENRRIKLDDLRKKQSSVQVEKTKALIQKHIDGPQYNLQQEDVDDRMIDFLSWFDYETAKNALEEYNRCVSDRVNNRKAFFMGILKRFRQTDGVE
uniref:RRM domain-containing protein n=1 Tax=Hyaloperonospora arabidopsidis (strain Emoy2) TaxID=559515 RepID=M4C6P6_HYAAE